MHFGIDLAWGANGRTGLAAVDDDGRLLASSSVRTDAEIAAWVGAQGIPTIVAFDAPLVVTNPTGRREAERLIGQAYARYDAGAYPTNLGIVHMDPPRARTLAARFDWQLDAAPTADSAALRTTAIEVYPHAGMIGLLGLGRVLPYKRGAYADRHGAFVVLLELLEGVPALALVTSPAWADLLRRFAAAERLADLDRLEDEIDAVFCAHLAWLWAARPGVLQRYGDPREGAIIAPPQPQHDPTPRGALVGGRAAAPRIAEASTAGVGPWAGPAEVFDDPRYDSDLLRNGDTRNVIDRYRYWTMAAIVADLGTRRHPFSVAIENWQHDLNIGSIVRTANAFAADTVHIIGRRRWNRRGAMVTDRYQHVLHHEDVAAFAAWAAAEGVPIVAVDNVADSVPVLTYPMPRRCVLLFGQEGPGLSPEAIGAAVAVIEIPQYGSTRSINASAAAAIVMHEWIRRWGGTAPT